MYAPAVVGLLLGRLVDMGPVMMYMFARILMLVFFALMTWWAMKKLPFGKAALFVIGLMPVTLQQAASLSYDVVVNAVTILFVSLVFYHSYTEEKIRIRDMILMAILSLWLLVAKGGAYLPLLLMLTFIPAIKLGGINKKRLVLSLFIGALVILFLFTSFGHLGTEGETVSVVTTQYYSISQLLRNPSILFNLGMGTALFNSGYYISTMIGQRLGFLNIILDDLVVYIYLFLMLLATIKKEDEPLYITGKNKMVMGVSIIGSVALVMASMLLFVTPVGSGTIQGVQGRYFIPVLWLVLMIFRNRSMVLKKDISYGIAFVAIVTHVLVFAYALKEIFML